MASVVGITDEGKPAWADFGNKAPSKFSVFLSAEAQFPPPPMADPATSQRYWNIAKPLIIELCNQWTATRKCASCTPDTLCTYLRNMYHTALPGEPPLPTASNPTAYAWAIESRLNGYQSPGLAALEYRGIKRHSEQGNEAERRVLARSRVEEVEEWEAAEDGDVIGNGASPARELPSPGTGAPHDQREGGERVDVQEKESSGMDITATASPASGAGGDACSRSTYSKSDRLRNSEGSGSPLWQTQDGAGVEFDRLLRQLREDADPFASPVGSPDEDGSLQSISDGDSPFTPPPPPWQPSEWDYFGRQSRPGSPDPLFVPLESPFEARESGGAAGHASHAAYPTVRPLELSLTDITEADITEADIDAAVDSWRPPDNLAQVAADTAAAVPRGSPPSTSHAPDSSPAERDLPGARGGTAEDSPSAEEKAAARWRGFRARSGPVDLTATWRQLSSMPLDKAPLGWAGADRLMQMVFNIASPAALVGVKHLLQHVRTEQACRPRAPVGGLAAAFTAGDWHATNEHASRIGQALAAWCIHHHRQQLQQEGHPDPMGQMVQEIHSQLPDGQRDRSKIEEKTREWNKRAWPWNQLVQLAGSPNILCFLPQDVGYFSGQEGSCMTHYRKLTKAHFEAMAQVFQEHRLPFFRSVPASFFEIFLYGQSPPGRFAIEDWTDYDILHEPLDSVRFDRAFQPTA